MENHKHIGALIKCIDQCIKNELNKQLEVYGITLAQLQALFFIRRQREEDRDVFQKDLEEHLYLTNPTVTGIVKRLEGKGLINRIQSNSDARYKSLYLTSEANRVLEDVKELGFNGIEKRLTVGLTSEEVQLLEQLLNRVLENIKK